MLYQICNGAVRFAAETILENINFEIRNTEKIAVVGRNGCGKTTLLKLISGEVELSKRDSDEDIYIAAAGKPVIGYLKQIAFENDDETLEGEVEKAFSEILQMKDRLEQLRQELEKNPTEERIEAYTKLEDRFTYLGGYTYEREKETVIRNLGFTPEDQKRKLSEFSGGQRTKIAFAKLLLSKPDILLLDEPTNHLDMDTILWLENYLKNYNRAVVIVSHDRMFLDHIVDVVYEIEYRTATRYPGNYSDFVKRKKENWEKQQKDYELQQKEIARLQALVDRFKNKPTKVAMTRSKLKAIEHMVKIDAPVRYDSKSFHASFKPARESYSEVLYVKDLKIGYQTASVNDSISGKVLTTVSFTQKKKQRIGIIGDNGTGKSTLLKTIVSQIPALGGEFRLGTQVDLGYFEQQMAQYESDKTVLDDFWDEWPRLTQNEVRSALGAFLFSGDDVYKKIHMLSGGEKVRLALCKIFKRRPNFLILDEPTNHMDIVGKEALEAMLKDFEGTILFVSHDRYFIREIADSLLIFSGGQVNYYPYDYAQYLEDQAAAAGRSTDGQQDAAVQSTVKQDAAEQSAAKQNRIIEQPSADVQDAAVQSTDGQNAAHTDGQSSTDGQNAASQSPDGQSNADMQSATEHITQISAKGYNPGKEESRRRRRAERLEAMIEDVEQQLEALQAEYAKPEIQADYERLTELDAQISDLVIEQDQLMEEWDELSSR